MKLRINQKGFSAVELIIVLLVAAALGLVGYTVYNRQQIKNTNSNSTGNLQPANASDVPPAPKVNSTDDLNKAQAALDQTDPSGSNSSDLSQLDSQTANF